MDDPGQSPLVPMLTLESLTLESPLTSVRFLLSTIDHLSDHLGLDEQLKALQQQRAGVEHEQQRLALGRAVERATAQAEQVGSCCLLCCCPHALAIRPLHGPSHAISHMHARRSCGPCSGSSTS